MKVQAIALSLLTLTGALPQAAFPINSQVPPVARVSQPYHFVFSASTFSSDTVITEYTLLGAPSWLQLDAGNRTFSGSPSPGDVGPVVFQLVAADPSGSTGMDVTFIVSPDLAPRVVEPLLDQLRKYGPTSAPASLLLSPSAQFTFTFDTGTFRNSAGGLNYYAVLADNTPLPSWIKFDPHTLRFSGYTLPWTSQSTPPQQFDIRLIASDVVGFSGASATFSLVVSNHIFFFDNSEQRLNASLGIPIHITDLRTHLLLDSQPIKDEDLKTVSATLPDWLHFNNKTFEISGTPVSGASAQTITISALDVHGDAAVHVIHVEISSGLFAGSIADLNADPGTDFIYNISRTIFTKLDVDVVAVFEPPISWLTFNPAILQLKGKIPVEPSVMDIEVSLIASSKDSSLSDSETFKIKIQRSSLSTTLSTPTPIQTDPGQSTGPQLLGSADLSSQKWKIATAVLLPFFGLIASIAALLCWGKRRRRKEKQSQQSPVISRPIQQEEEIVGPWPSPEKPRKLSVGTPQRAPMLQNLSGMWKCSTDFHTQNYQRPNDQEITQEKGASLTSLDRELTRSREFTRELNRSPLGASTGSQATCNFSLKDPGKISRSQKHQSTSGPAAISHARASSRRSNRYSGSVQRRISGVGHGSGGYGPPGYGIPRRSWRQKSSSGNWATIRCSDDSGLTESTDVLIGQFPSIRVVTSPHTARLSSAETQRRSFALRRGQSPFFAGSSRYGTSQGSPHPLGCAMGDSPDSITAKNSRGAASLLDSVLYELSTQGTMESLSFSATPEVTKAFTNDLGPRISRGSMTSKLSDSSSRFRSANDSTSLICSPRKPESIADSEDEGSWYHRPHSFFGRHGLSLVGAESKPDILEYETVRLRGVTSPRDTQGISTASPMLKVVDFKGKRPVSVEGSQTNLKNSESETGDVAFL